jgi:NitT/TauT family transport system substrate-binding protein
LLGWLAATPLALTGCLAPAEPIRLGSIVFSGYEPIFLAREMGWLPQDQVKLVELLSNTDTLRALSTLRLEAAQLTLDEFVTARADGLDLRVIAVLDVSEGADAVIGRPGLDKSALRGQRIAYEDGAAGAVMMQSFLDAQGLQPADVIKMPMTLDRSVEMFKSRQADYIVTAEPWVTQLESLGGVRVFDSTAIPGRIVDVMVAREDVIERRGGALRTLVGAHFRARDYVLAEPTKAAELIAPRLQVTPEEVPSAFRGLRLPDAADSRARLTDETRLMSKVHRLQDKMLEDGLIQKRLEMKDLFDARFHPAV